MAIARVFHPYTVWEDFKAGMWDSCAAKDRETLLQVAIEFTGNAELYGSFMRRVVNEWPLSTEHNLSDTGQNRQAWLGHAAACLAHGLPEYITREAWGYLSQQQQDDANAQASLSIQLWEAGRAGKN